VNLALLIRSTIRDAWKQGRYGCGEPDMDRAMGKIGQSLDDYREALMQCRPSVCDRCKGSGIDPEDSMPATGPTEHSMGEPPVLEPCRDCYDPAPGAVVRVTSYDPTEDR
jgi:hypothetical protein